MSKKDNDKVEKVDKVTKKSSKKTKEPTIRKLVITNHSDLYEEVNYNGENYMLLSGGSLVLEVEKDNVENVKNYLTQTLDNIQIEERL